MTAYLSRLLPGPSPQIGIRPRPRSRYEPEPEAPLAHDPTEIDAHSAAAQPHQITRWPSDSTAPPPQPRPTSTGTPAVTPQSPAVPAPDSHLPSGPSLPAGTPAATAYDPRTDDTTDRQHGVHASRAQHSHAHAPRPAPPQTTPDPPSVRPDTRSAPPSEHSTATPASRRDRTAITSTPAPPAATGPARTENPAAATTNTATPGPAPHRSDHRHRPAEHDAARRRVTTDPDAAANPAVRAHIRNAIAEPVRTAPTEITVHIDRIDVRTPSPTPPAAQEAHHPKAAPTSLDSYLRARSRRAR